MKYKSHLLLFFLYSFFLLNIPVHAGFLENANDLYNQGKLAEAIPVYKQAASDGENPAMCYFNLANAYFQLDSLPQSIVYYKSAIVYAPEFFRNHFNLAIAYYTLEDLGECIATIKRALQIEPDNEQSMTILAASYRKAGAISEAIIAFEQLIKMYPENEKAYIALGEMYRDLSNDDQAISFLIKYPESGQNESYVYQILSEIYEANKNLERALYYTKASFAKESSNKWICYKICILLEQMGNDLVALEEAKRGLEQFPDFSDLAVLAGNIAMKYEKLDDAKILYTIADKYGHPYAVVGLDNIRKIILSKTQQDEP